MTLNVFQYFSINIEILNIQSKAANLAKVLTDQNQTNGAALDSLLIAETPSGKTLSFLYKLLTTYGYLFCRYKIIRVVHYRKCS